MGNSLVVGNSGSTPRFPCHLQLGASAAIELSKRVDTKLDDGSSIEHWTVLYTVDGKTCDFTLRRLVDKDGNVKTACFRLCDSIYLNSWLRLQMQRTEKLSGSDCIPWTKTKRTIDAWGGVMDTKVYLYGSGNRGGLLVVEERRKNSSNEQYQYDAATVAHYYANCNGTAFDRTETDIGLSVVAKIRAFNQNLDVTVEGPEQHPVSALFYMFSEVNRTGTWKPSMCPHCDNIRRGRMFWQSDSEDSDSVALTSPRRGSRQNGRSIANDGSRFKGNGNASSIVCKYFYGS